MKKLNKILILPALVLIVAFQGTAVFAAYGVQEKAKGCKANQVLQDSACTPGTVLTTDLPTICKTGYTKTVRDVPLKVRKQVFFEYGIPYRLSSKYEVDHLISLELGGSNDISNLWPEPYGLKNGARIKDKFENYLHDQVCSYKMDIGEAQLEISGDWLLYYTNMPPKRVVIPAPAPAPVPAPAIVMPPAPSNDTVAEEPAVKMSKSGICHEKGTRYYNQTKNFTPFDSIDACLASGGRLPK